MYIKIKIYLYYYFDILIIESQAKSIYFIFIDCYQCFDDWKIQNAS